MKTDLYQETAGVGNEHRARMLREVQDLIRNEQKNADQRREQFFQPVFDSIESYEDSIAGYRPKLRQMLGWPLTMDRKPYATPSARFEAVAEDSLGRISRVWIETLPGVHTYGLYFCPHGGGRFPFVISQHGGGGTPELCSGFFGSANYNDMTRRVLRRGIAVFAPQLLLWDPMSYGPEHEKEILERRLKQIGGSLAALELLRLITVLDCFTTREEIDGGRVGMIGLSYGGFYTLFATALDVRIKAAICSGFFNDRKLYDYHDLSWFDSANRFLDAEVGALVCPRPLYCETGKKDNIFDVEKARPEIKKLQAIYERLGISDRLCYKEHEGGHELAKADDGIDFLCHHLGCNKAGQ